MAFLRLDCCRCRRNTAAISLESGAIYEVGTPVFCQPCSMLLKQQNEHLMDERDAAHRERNRLSQRVSELERELKTLKETSSNVRVENLS